MKEEIKLFYDLTAEKTASEWYENDILMPTIKEFVSLFPGTPRILDLGCGPGHETKRLASLGADVMGIDFSAECIHIARKRCLGCEFKVMDFRELDDDIGRFDGIFASGALIHLDLDELPEVIRRISDVLQPNGYFLTIIQDGEGVNEKCSNLKVDGRILKRTVYCYTKDILRGIVRKFSLEFVKEGFLNKSLFEQNWRNYIFKKI